MRRSMREWWFACADRLRNLDPDHRMFVVMVIVGIAAAGLIVITAPSPLKTPTLDPPDATQQPQTNIASFTNRAAGYGFRYPTAWNIAEREAATDLSSPTGRILLSFGVSSSDALARIVRRVERFKFATVESIGTSRERIDGARAFLSAGLTQTRTGRAIRFLAIAVDGELGAYTISVAVPAHANPQRVLPKVERIISSFQTTPRYVA
jgi:hypothetical protein